MRRYWLVGASAALVLAFIAPAAALDRASAETFVRDLYKPYLGKSADGFSWSTADVRRVFETTLAAMILRDRTRPEGGVLDFDPFIDAQDFDIASVETSVESASATEASVSAKFHNIDTDTTVTFALVVQGGQWRIRDLKTPNLIEGLRARLAAGPPQNTPAAGH